ncbi:MAG: histidinol-phosphatase HisJ family protein [Acidobacteria bacterium]|nr:histidinol-phosphatase HisJ family protein [Acidobacteriota bacterium]
MSQRHPWKVSLHGGHSGEFCEHAVSTLREVLEAAVNAEFSVFGVSEHAPRSQARFLYPSEVEKGYTLERLHQEFAAYEAELARLAEELQDRLTVLRGFEAEIVPAEGYREEMLAHRRRFEYMVGSVHYVDEIQIDGSQEEFDAALAGAGGLEALAVRYYEAVAAMAEALRPEVVGHLDLIRRRAPLDADLATPAIQKAADRALEAVAAADAVLDLNTAGWRKGLGGPYPAPWLVARADAMGIGFCFGDDSHGPQDVGAGVEAARDYLLEHGVSRVRRLNRLDGAIVKEWIPL